MAKNKDYTKQYLYTKLNGTTEWGSFNELPGSIVEGFLKSLLEDSVVDFDYDTSDFTLSGKNAFGETVCSTRIVNADPSYSVDFQFINVTVGNRDPFTGTDSSVLINKAGNLNVKTSFKFIVTGNVAGNEFNDTSAQQVTFGWYNDAECTDLDRTLPTQTSTINPGEIVTVSLNKMFEYAFTNKYLGIEFLTKTQTGTLTQRYAFASKLTLKALILSYNGGYLVRSNIISGLLLQGLNSNEQVSDYYYSYYLDNTTNQHSVLTGTNTNLTLNLGNLSEGIHNLFVRVQNSENDSNASLVSNDLQISFIYQKESDSSLTSAIALVTAIPDSINNCDTSRLFQVVTTDYLLGNIRIIVLKSSNLGNIATINNIDDALNSEYIFKDVTFNLSITDKSNTINYNSYIEVESTSEEYLKVLTYNGYNTVESMFYSRQSSITVTTVKYKTIEVINPKNGISHLTAVKGAILDFSQINNGNVFTNLNPNMDESDGFQLETENNASISVFKVSPIANVFTEPKKLVTSANTNLNNGPFSIEMVIKTYNCPDLEDEILSIGNIKLCPKHLFVYRENEELGTDPTLIRNASRADFLKNKKLHITITFDPNYKPSTYLNLYDKLFSADNVSYSNNAEAYPCLKIYIDGTINRTIKLSSEDLESDGFNFQIHPSSSNINFYSFKTYDKALSYTEIRLNVASLMLTLSEKEHFYEYNDILYNDDDFAVGHNKQHLLGTISLGKCLNKFKSVGNPKQYKNRRVLLLALPEGVLPPYYGNRKDDESVATFLVNYPNDTKHSGRLLPQDIEGGKGTIKAQGSSAKKYLLMHNTSYSKFIFVAEDQWHLEEPLTFDYYKMPGDDVTKIKKLVGKVNTASSMQSHKQGSTKMFHDAYIASGLDTSWMNEGRKAVLEDDFLYFYVNVPKEDLDKLTWEYFKDEETGEYNFENCYFVGFHTWGSAKGDEATSGYNENTPYYVMLEGADNANAAANFKVPWAAMQCWKDTNNSESEFELFSGKTSDGSFDYLTNLLINDETIVYNPGVESENSTDKRADAWDVDFGVKKGTNYNEDDNPVYEFEEKAKVSLNRFAEFYNLIYKYDFSSLVFIPNQTTIILDSEKGIEDSKGNTYGKTYNKIVFGDDCYVKMKSSDTLTKVTPGDIYRYDKRWADDVIGAPKVSKWVPAGLTYTNGVWDSLNIYDLCNEYSFDSTGFFSLSDYDDLRTKSGESNFEYYLANDDNASRWTHTAYPDNPNYWNNYIKILAEAFKIIVHEYTDHLDIAYHQAFIKFIAGTDNRAKNTYFQIVGPIAPDNSYEINKENLRKDFKIRLYQDDLDTIFKTDNNGQQIKPYYLLEPMFNKDLEHLWGDLHSGFFYNVDLVYTEEIKVALGKILDFASGGFWPDNDNSNIYKYFLSILKNLPSIAYNHHSEIYYETAETVFQDGVGTKFYNSLKESSNSKNWKDFSNNLVSNPLSLSHGSCYDAEVEYLKDRLLLLSTYTGKGKPTTDVSIPWKGGSQESDSKYYDIKLNYTSFIQYIYPTIIGIQMDNDKSFLNYDPIIDKLYSNNLDVVYNIAVPNKEHEFELSISLNGLTSSPKWENTDLYKTVFIESGLEDASRFLAFPNANTVICTDSQYSISTGTSEQIDVESFMSSVEHLILQNATINSLGFNFSKCNRLKTLVLGKTVNNKTDDPEPTKDSVYYALKIKDVLDASKDVTLYQNEGCKGFTQIVLPNSNTLEYINIPNCVKILNMGYYPNLKTFECNDGTEITNLVIDGRNDSSILNTLISKYVSTEASVYIVNIPSEGLWLTEQTCNILARIDNLVVDGFINIGTDNTLTAISFNTKKVLVDKFGNIDDSSNKVYFKYSPKVITTANHDQSASIQSSGYAPVKLNLNGNNVLIENNMLKIVYSLLTVGSNTLDSDKISINKNTGYLTIEEGYECTCMVRTIIYHGNTSTTIDTTLTVGFYRPLVGDLAYGNGTFSPAFDNTLGLVGLVYYSERIDDNSLEVRVLSKEFIEDVLGPCKSYVGSSVYEEKEEIQEQYLGFLQSLFADDYSVYYKDTKEVNAPSGTITYNSPTLNSLKSSVKLTSDEHTNQMEYLNRVNDYTQALNSNLSLNLGNLGTETITDQDVLTYTNIYSTVLAIKELLIGSNGYKNLNFTQNLYPAIIKTLYYKPQVTLTGKGETYFGRGNWYVPTNSELSLLIHYRIGSSISNNTSTEKYWNSVTYVPNSVGGDCVFNDVAFSNISFLRILDAINAIECDDNGAGYYYNNSVYSDGDPSWKCATIWYETTGLRDVTLKVFPCCRIILTK